MSLSPSARTPFSRAVFNQNLGQGFLDLAGLSAQILNLVRARFTGCVAAKALLAGPQELLRPAVIEVLVDALAAQLDDAVLTGKVFQHDAGFVTAEKCHHVARRMSQTVFSTLTAARSLRGHIVPSCRVRMRQKLSLIYSYSTQQALTTYIDMAPAEIPPTNPNELILL
jgi:hypothetical protein